MGRDDRKAWTGARTMILRVAEEGLVIPKDWLDGAERFEVRREDGRIVVEPAAEAARDGEGPAPDEPEKVGSIFELLGRDPVDIGITDASVRHDHYIYGNPH